MVLTTKKGNSKILATLLDDGIPIAHRKRMLAELCINEDDAATAVIQGLLKAATAGSGKDLYTQKKDELQVLTDGAPDYLGSYVLCELVRASDVEE